MAEYGGAATGIGTQYVAADHLGSTRMVQDGQGNCAVRMDYAPYGGVVPRSGQDCYATPWTSGRMFTGALRDGATELDHMEARQYWASLGRFTSPDEPLTYADPANPQSWNLYAYGLNNPLLYSDPDGHEPCVNGVNPENGNICTVVKAPKPADPPALSFLTEMFLHSLLKTAQAAQQTQQIIQPAMDWLSQPRNPWCLASAVGAGAGTGAVAGLAGGPGGLVTVPGGFLAGGLAGGSIGLSTCMSNSGPTSSGGGGPSSGRSWSYGGHKLSQKWRNQMAKRGWTEQQIDEAIARGQRFAAPTKLIQETAQHGMCTRQQVDQSLSTMSRENCFTSGELGSPINSMIIYIRLLDEGTDVARPTECVDLGNGLYRVLASADYDSEEEKWEFQPDSIVRVEQRRGSVGDYLLAVSP